MKHIPNKSPFTKSPRSNPKNGGSFWSDDGKRRCGSYYKGRAGLYVQWVGYPGRKFYRTLAEAMEISEVFFK